MLLVEALSPQGLLLLLLLLLEELVVGPLAKTISLCIEGHPALVYFLPQFERQVTAMLERLTIT